MKIGERTLEYTDVKCKVDKYKKKHTSTFASTDELEVCWVYHLGKRSCLSLQIDH